MTSTRNLGRDLENFMIRSPAVTVRFAGFTSDTWTLQRNGWQLSCEQGFSPFSADYTVRLALKNEQARLYALTNTIELARHWIGMAMTGQYREFAENVQKIEFHVQHMSTSMSVVIPERAQFATAWNAFDALPSYEAIQSKEMSLDQFCLFKPINHNVDLILDQKSVAEVMAFILKKQAPKQAEIREKLRKEKLREKFGEFDGYEPTKDIKAQIISIAG